MRCIYENSLRLFSQIHPLIQSAFGCSGLAFAFEITAEPRDLIELSRFVAIADTIGGSVARPKQATVKKIVPVRMSVEEKKNVSNLRDRDTAADLIEQFVVTGGKNGPFHRFQGSTAIILHQGGR